MKTRLLALLIVFAGCEPPPAPPSPVVKKISVKVHEQYSDSDIDGAALVFGGRIRSVPVIKNRYRMYAEDGTYVDVSPYLFASTKEGEEIQSTGWSK